MNAPLLKLTLANAGIWTVVAVELARWLGFSHPRQYRDGDGR